MKAFKSELQSYERKLYDKKFEYEQKCREEMKLFEKELALENANEEEPPIQALITRIKNLKETNVSLKSKS